MTLNERLCGLLIAINRLYVALTEGIVHFLLLC